MSSSVLSCENVHKSYRSGKKRIHVLSGVDLQVDTGEFLCIIGASGVGKSTLLHILGGLQHPDDGRVICNDISLYQESSSADLARLRNEFFGFVFQSHHLLPEFSALENVLMPYWVRRGAKGDSLRQARERGRTLLERVGLRDRETHRPNELSGGEQQRVALARALMNQPQVVLADEPTGNLDEGTSHSMLNLLMELNEQLGQSFVVATHNLGIAEQSHRVVEITGGKAILQRQR